MDTHPKELSLGQDKVCVRDLQLPHGLVVPNVWGDYKEQPVFVSLELTLNPGFQTAASKDVLDQNTIHYGQLAKKVRAASTADQTDTGFRQRLDRILTEMSQRPDGTRRISRSKVDLCLQKGSMYGAVLRITTVTDWDKDVSGWVSQACIRFEAMQVMTLIGVNEYERRRKQPLLVWLDVLMDDGLGVIDPSMSPAVSGLEDVVVQASVAIEIHHHSC